MARVVVPPGALSDAEALPRVCVLSGRPADGTTELRLVHVPGWTWLVLLVMFLPPVELTLPGAVLLLLVVSWFAADRVDARLPVNRAALLQHHRRRRVAALTAVAGVLAAVGGLLGDATWLVWVGVVTAVIGLFGLQLLAGMRPSMRRGTPDPSHLELRRVHADFAHAVRASDAGS